MTQRALALDLATRYGYAAETPHGIVHGSLQIGRDGDDMGRRFAAFETQFRAFLMPECRPTDVLIEAPWVSGDDAATHFLIGLVGVARMLCAKRGLNVRTMNVPSIREQLTGIGNAPKGAVDRVVRECGFDPRDDNAADALAMLIVHRGWHRRLQPGAEIVSFAAA